MLRLEASIPSLLGLSVGLKKSKSFVIGEETEARLAPRCCTVEINQLNMCTENAKA